MQLSAAWPSAVGSIGTRDVLRLLSVKGTHRRSFIHSFIDAVDNSLVVCEPDMPQRVGGRSAQEKFHVLFR